MGLEYKYNAEERGRWVAFFLAKGVFNPCALCGRLCLDWPAALDYFGEESDGTESRMLQNECKKSGLVDPLDYGHKKGHSICSHCN